MDILKRVVAVYLALIALAAFTLLIITPLYHDGSAEYPHWQILNYFMAVGVVVVLAPRTVSTPQVGGRSRHVGIPANVPSCFTVRSCSRCSSFGSGSGPSTRRVRRATR